MKHTLLLTTASLLISSLTQMNAQEVTEVKKIYRNKPQKGFIPEISLIGNKEEIPDGDTIPLLKNNTHFGNVRTFYSQTHEFFISNSGPAGLVVSDIYFTGENADEYTLIETPSYPINIESGKEFSIQVIFKPTMGGTRSATLNILNNDLDEGLYDVRLEAEATFITEIEESITNLTGLHVYPNPVQDRATIQIESTVQQAGVIRLLNMQGQEVLPASAITLSKGFQNIDIATLNLDNGIYYVIFSSGVEQNINRMVVAH